MDEKTKILIVDDEPINLEFFEVMLTKLGFAVDRAEDGEQALERVKAFNPDLVILDNIMPKLSGWKVTRILKNEEEYAEFKDIPIIMFSAMDDVKDKIEGFELGIEDYITKPFNFSEVLARIRAVLRSRELSKQVLAKERKLATLESLNQSLFYFSQQLKEPVDQILKQSKKLDTGNQEDVNEFVAKVTDENERIAASLDALHEEIEDLKKSVPGDNSNVLDDLEQKFQAYFTNWKKKQNSTSEV